MFLSITIWVLVAVALFFLTLYFGPIVPLLFVLGMLIYATGRLVERQRPRAWARPGLPVMMFAMLMFYGGQAFAAEINIGQALNGSLQEIINAAITGLIAALVGWVAIVVKNKFNIDIEAQHRDALTAFLQRQASGLVAMGAVKLEGVKVEVQSEALAAAANSALAAIPGALAFFGLTPAKIQSMIVDMLPKQPSIAQAQAVALDVANPATPTPST